MADVVLLAGGTPKSVSATSYFYMDAVVSVTATHSSDVSAYPVQKLGSVSDNVVNKNVIINVKGNITNHFVPQEAKPAAPDENQDMVGFTSNRVTKGLSLLYDFWKNKKFFTIVLEHKVYPNCVLREAPFEFTNATSDSLDINLTFEQLRTVDIARVITYDIVESKKDEPNNTTGGGQAGKTDKGEVTKEGVTDSPTDQYSRDKEAADKMWNDAVEESMKAFGMMPDTP